MLWLCPWKAVKKSAQSPHGSNLPPNHTLSSDTMGPLSPPSTLGHRHILTILNTATRYDVAIPIRTRAEVGPMTAQAIKNIRTQLQHHICRLHSDNAKEFTTSPLATFLNSHGIRQTTTIAHHPEHNGLSERWIWTILNAARAALVHSRLRELYWHLVVADATYKYNCIPLSATGHPPHKL